MPTLVEQIDRDLEPGGAPDQLRRAATSAAAALERGGQATRWRTVLIERTRVDGGVARAVVSGLAGVAAADPGTADAIAAQMVVYGGLDAIEALVELDREEGTLALPETLGVARDWIERALAKDDGSDDGRLALLHVLRSELGGTGVTDGLATAATDVRARLDAGELPAAVGRAQAALDELEAATEWLERASDDDVVDRRQSLRLLRELDRTFLSDGTVIGALTLAPDGEASIAALAGLLARLERALVERETQPETRGAVPHYRLRLARLRALVRLLDGQVVASDDGDRRATRLASTRALMARARGDASPLRRAVWAALTRSWDAMLRQDDAEVSDLLFGLTAAFDPDEDFAIVREATMEPVVEAVIDAYARLTAAVWAAADPDDDVALTAALDALDALDAALPRGISPRVESVRARLADLGRALRGLAEVPSRSALDVAMIDELAGRVTVLGARAVGAYRRLGLPLPAQLPHEEPIRAVARAIERVQQGDQGDCDTEVAIAIEALTGQLPPAIAGLTARVLTRLARLPLEGEAPVILLREAVLPAWLPLSRTLGGFYVIRPIGTGAGGSVFVACRAEERGAADAEKFALKVPDYDGGAARALSDAEFETMFREEAGALLAIPAHENLAGFVTFDARAKPKPLLVMELVRGPTLERVLELGGLDLPRAFAVIDGIGAGLEAMHAVRVAHLDIKPPNVILRADASGRGGAPVLVDFGLAGRSLRPGCGSPYYGAPEVWSSQPVLTEPRPTDVYAYACIAYELLTGELLVDAETLPGVLSLHRQGAAAARARAGSSARQPSRRSARCSRRRSPSIRASGRRWRGCARASPPWCPTWSPRAGRWRAEPTPRPGRGQRRPAAARAAPSSHRCSSSSLPSSRAGVRCTVGWAASTVGSCRRARPTMTSGWSSPARTAASATEPVAATRNPSRRSRWVSCLRRSASTSTRTRRVSASRSTEITGAEPRAIRPMGDPGLASTRSGGRFIDTTALHRRCQSPSPRPRTQTRSPARAGALDLGLRTPAIMAVPSGERASM
ncbi:MAG: protein kinase [Kofleriaceae bacterium]